MRQTHKFISWCRKYFTLNLNQWFWSQNWKFHKYRLQCHMIYTISTKYLNSWSQWRLSSHPLRYKYFSQFLKSPAITHKYTQALNKDWILLILTVYNHFQHLILILFILSAIKSDQRRLSLYSMLPLPNILEIRLWKISILSARKSGLELSICLELWKCSNKLILERMLNYLRYRSIRALLCHIIWKLFKLSMWFN